MRKIDADALKEKFVDDDEALRWQYIWVVRKEIDDAPTIEERKGRWIITKRNGILCGVCHSGLRRMPTLGGKPMFVYCPFCGAKMEGSKEE